MKKEALYTQWKNHRRNVPVPEEFAKGIMAEINANQQRGGCGPPLEEPGFSSRLTQWAAGAGFVMLGLFRILYIALSLLRAHPLTLY